MPHNKVIIYNGWPLVYAPDSAAALHLLALLEHHPAVTQGKAIIALPGSPLEPLAIETLAGGNVEVLVNPTPDTPWARLRWEQRFLPGLAEKHGLAHLHLTTSEIPLFGRMPITLSPTEFLEPARIGSQPHKKGLGERLRLAMGHGGSERVTQLLWPFDLPICAPYDVFPVEPGRPILPPGFGPDVGIQESVTEADEFLATLELPTTFVLYHGPHTPAAHQRLLRSWNWAAGAVGEHYPLVILGAHGTAYHQLLQTMRSFDLGATVIILPPQPASRVRLLYQHCTVLFHPAGPAPWGDPIRLALSCGKPVVAASHPLTEALVESAAYLAAPEDTRALGAALLSTIVDETVAEHLAQAARQRASTWL